MRTVPRCAAGLLALVLARPATAQYLPYTPPSMEHHFLQRDLDSPYATPQEKIEALRGLQRLQEQEMRERMRALEFQQFRDGLDAALESARRPR